jgi:probable F420-dependent oxidoreductase
MTPAAEGQPTPSHDPSERPFRFGVLVKGVVDPTEWRARARYIEELGYQALVMPDHMPKHLAVMPALVAAAGATSTLRFGPFVAANDYRNPVLLAKEAATVDVLSEGRLDLALGTGWYEPDYRMLGISLDSPGDRVSRLEESICLIKRLWTEEQVSHTGRWYTVTDVSIVPQPTQQPHPPIMIGGSRPRMLRLGGREADIVSIAGGYSAEEMDERIDIVRDAAGPRLGEIELNTTVTVAVVDDPEPLYREAESDGMTVSQIIESPNYLYGSLDSLRDQLLVRRKRFGLTYYVVNEEAFEAFAPLARELGAP